MPPSTLKRQWFDVPGETNKVELRPLSILELQEARRIKDRETTEEAERIMSRIDAETLAQALASPEAEEAREARRASRENVAADDTNPNNFDLATVLRCGIVAWDYTNGDGSPFPCTDEDKVSFYGEAGDWLVKTILGLSARTPGNANGSEKSFVQMRSRRS